MLDQTSCSLNHQHAVRALYAGAFQFVAHASAHVEDHAQRDGSVFAGKMPDVFRLGTFKELKVVFLQTRDQPVHGISNCHVHQHQVHVYFHRRRVGLERGINIWLRRRLGLGRRRYVHLILGLLREGSD